MGCCSSTAAGGEEEVVKANPHTKFVEGLFSSTGTQRKLDNGAELIKQGSESESAFYIKEGKIDLILTDNSGNQNKLATRGPGDVLGELSLLLGHDTSVAAVANGTATVIEVKSDALLNMLREDPVQSGRLFKVMATYLSERISELSSKMRSNVTAKGQTGPTAKTDMPATDMAKAYQMFQISKEEKLFSVYQCSVRARPSSALPCAAFFVGRSRDRGASMRHAERRVAARG